MAGRHAGLVELAVFGFFQVTAVSAGTLIFPDDFEKGATCAWSATVSPVIPGGCLIGGVNYCPGDFNPVDPCQHCEPQTSQVAWIQVVEGGPCDDGSACTITDECSSGTCSGVPNDALCDDGLDCTQDYCDGAAGCGQLPFDNLCSGCEVCDPGQDPNVNVSGCVAAPSCCGNGFPETGEECDDGDADETDGCTSQCQAGPLCTSDAVPGGDRFEVDPATARCYVSFDDDQTTFDAAELACESAGGTLVAITTGAEQSIVASVRNVAQNPWIGASDADVEGDFAWVTSEAFSYTSWAAGEPDDDTGSGGNGDCVALEAASGDWIDTNCNFVGFVTGRICELPPS